MTSDVSHSPRSGLATAHRQGSQAGTLTYSVSRRSDPEVWTLYSTRVDPDHEGRGVGSDLVRIVLDDARSAGAVVDPTCWFVAGWIRRHPDYEDLLAPR